MMALTVPVTNLKSNPVFKFYKYHVIDSILLVKRHGLEELLRQRGWKFVLLVGGYYLVRDTIVYIAIPLCIARGIF